MKKEIREHALSVALGIRKELDTVEKLIEEARQIEKYIRGEPSSSRAN